MQQWLDSCMTGNFEKKHILPFFWQHGETRDVLEEEINAIKMSGINEFCVESRVHLYFCEDKWWEDFQFLLDEAEKRKMRVWLLDDKKFPTGYANNYIKDFPDLRKVSIRVEYRDFYGPSYDCSVIAPFLEEGESYISVTAFNRKKNGNDFYGIPVDLMPAMSDGFLRFDIPDWRNQHITTTCNSLDMDKWKQMSGHVFKELIDAGVYSVMAGHITLLAYQKNKFENGMNLPATLSYELVSNLLKKKWDLMALLFPMRLIWVGF